jgi:ATP-dependent RNA helicase HelY
MPARCVVLERLVKFNGEAHVDLTAGEYTQLTGRAGRRGIDIEGHAVVVWSPDLDPRHVAGLASTRTYPLRSSFRPSYNMAVNLVGTVGAKRARALLESSFAQFQADRSVVGVARQVRTNTETAGVYAAEMACDRGDFDSYFALRVIIGEREKSLARSTAAARRAAAVTALEKLKAGDVIRVPAGKRAGLAVVLDPGVGGFTEPRPLVLTEDRWAGRMSIVDFSAPVAALARVRVPKGFNHRSPAARRDLAASLRAARVDDAHRPARVRRSAADDSELERLRRELRAHPCHACPDRDEHVRWAERRWRLVRDTEALRAKMASRTGSLARTFDQVCAVLRERGYLAAGGAGKDTADGGMTEAGRMLARIWTEADLLVAECIRGGVWDGLAPAELAGAVSVVVYEARRDIDEHAPVPYGPIGEAVDATARLWTDLSARESAAGLEPTRAPDPGFVWPIYRWGRGEPLSKVLASAHTADGDMPAGDFVRWARQVIDLLGQIAEAAGAASPLRETARQAGRLLNRGILDYSGAA